jgi:ABC-type microcin C transport system duplicated ATPase subunit YejF
LIAPSEGRVLLEGTDISGARGAELRKPRRRIQLVFQEPYSSLDPRRRVGAQIADGARIHKIATSSQWRARVESLLRQVGLDPTLGDRFPHKFSGGQRQRIGIARALFH